MSRCVRCESWMGDAALLPLQLSVRPPTSHQCASASLPVPVARGQLSHCISGLTLWSEPGLDDTALCGSGEADERDVSSEETGDCEPDAREALSSSAPCSPSNSGLLLTEAGEYAGLSGDGLQGDGSMLTPAPGSTLHMLRNMLRAPTGGDAQSEAGCMDIARLGC